MSEPKARRDVPISHTLYECNAKNALDFLIVLLGVKHVNATLDATIGAM
jgi:hypothetical protein